METVSFKCGSCGQVIAVLAAHVGQQVRCPHCQQAVTAPPAASPPSAAPPGAPEPTFAIVSREESESIFSEPTVSEDLFGQPSGKVELPAEMAATEPVLQMPNMELGPSQPWYQDPTLRQPESPAPAPPQETTMTEAVSPAWYQDPTLTHTQPEPPPEPAPPPEIAARPEAPAPWSPPNDVSMPDGPATSDVFPKRPRAGRGWHIALVIFPLVSYAILATIAVAVLYFRLRAQDTEQKTQQQQPGGPHPLENLPDLQGDNPTGQRPKKPVTDRAQEWYYTMEPSKVLRLGETATLGDVEITPLRVERGPIQVIEIGKAMPVDKPARALKLFLRFRNVSKDLSFCPTDRCFNRYYNMTDKKDPQRFSDSTNPPLTALVIGKKRFYGGPAGYCAKTDDPTGNWVNEAVVGQNANKKLAPGQEMETFICTDPENEELQATLENHKGALRWRVHFRRGAVEVRGRRIPATAVIGVEFTEKDIKPAG